MNTNQYQGFFRLFKSSNKWKHDEKADQEFPECLCKIRNLNNRLSKSRKSFIYWFEFLSFESVSSGEDKFLHSIKCLKLVHQSNLDWIPGFADQAESKKQNFTIRPSTGDRGRSITRLLRSYIYLRQHSHNCHRREIFAGSTSASSIK